MSLEIKSFHGREIEACLDEAATVLSEIFMEFPYLYCGDVEYEKEYLQPFLECESSALFAAYSEGKIVGVSTAIPLEEEEERFYAPLAAIGYKPEEIMYFGDSVLRKEYRGQGIGREFFRLREQHARKKCGRKYATFCRVIREADDPRRPADYVPLDGMWTKFGYKCLEGVVTSYPWADIGEEKPTEKAMEYWIGALNNG